MRLAVTLDAAGFITLMKVRNEFMVARPGHVWESATSENVGDKNVGAQVDKKEDKSLSTQHFSTLWGTSCRAHARVKVKRRIISVDHGGVIAPGILRPAQLDHLIDMIDDCGEAFDGVIARLTALNLDGSAPGKVRSWLYFEALIEEAKGGSRASINGFTIDDFGSWRETEFGDAPFAMLSHDAFDAGKEEK
jgi:hypothetical protein